MTNRRPRALPIHLKMTGWQPSAASCIAIMIAISITPPLPHAQEMLFPSQRVVDTIVPLLFALQAAFLLSPESDPPLELILSSGYSMRKLLWLRVIILLALQGAAALCGNAAVNLLLGQRESLLISFLRWFPACIFAGGAAVYTTLLTRQGVFGALLALLLWAGMRFGMDALLTRFPDFWPIHIYLQPQSSPFPIYMANRIFLAISGVSFIALAAELASKEERMLGFTGGKR